MPTMIIAANCDTSASRPRRELLRAMGCAVDDAGRPGARNWAGSRRDRWRKFLPPLAAAHGARIGIDINVTAREFGSALVWSVRFEDGSRRDGVTSTADCRRDLARRGRGIVDHAPAFRIALRSAAGLSRIGGEDRRRRRRDRCLLIVSPPQCYEPPAIVVGPAAVGRGRATVYAAVARQLGHRRFQRSADR